MANGYCTICHKEHADGSNCADLPPYSAETITTGGDLPAADVAQTSIELAVARHKDTMSARLGYRESHAINDHGFRAEVSRDPDRAGWYIARGVCRSCGETVESDAKDNGSIMPGTSRGIESIVTPFREHREWHDIRRDASWDLALSVLKRALATSALSEVDRADLFVALERGNRKRVQAERELCALTVERECAFGAEIAERLRNPTAADYGMVVNLSLGGNVLVGGGGGGGGGGSIVVHTRDPE